MFIFEASYLSFGFLLLFCSGATSHHPSNLVPQTSNIHSHSYTPTDFQILAKAEESVISSLRKGIRSAPMLDGELVSELVYFLDFIEEDAGALDLNHPVTRFKLIERVLFDWPQVDAIAAETDLEVDVMKALLVDSGVKVHPNHGHLLTTVQDLNDIISFHNISHDSVKAGDPLLPGSSSVPLNSGNTLLLTNFSRDLGQVEHCVRWGEITDKELVTSPEPFAVPGEVYWIHFYTTYLECLVMSG